MTLDQILKLTCVCCDKLAHVVMPAINTDDPAKVLTQADGLPVVPLCKSCAVRSIEAQAEDIERDRSRQERRRLRAEWLKTSEGQAELARKKARASIKAWYESAPA